MFCNVSTRLRHCTNTGKKIHSFNVCWNHSIAIKKNFSSVCCFKFFAVLSITSFSELINLFKSHSWQINRRQITSRAFSFFIWLCFYWTIGQWHFSDIILHDTPWRLSHFFVLHFAAIALLLFCILPQLRLCLYFAASSSHCDRLSYCCLLFWSHSRLHCCFANVFLPGNPIKWIKIATVIKILCDNPIYSFKWYAINQCFYLIRDRIWFGISDLYAIKQCMRLSGMRLTDFVCTNKITCLNAVTQFWPRNWRLRHIRQCTRDGQTEPSLRIFNSELLMPQLLFCCRLLYETHLCNERIQLG